MVYLQELDFEMGISQYLVSFSEAMNCTHFEKWKKRCHKEELKSIEQNNVWDLVLLWEGSKRVGYKWVFKTKYD